LFFENEDSEYYLREMARITGVPATNIRRELKKLEEDKLFVLNRRGNLLFYKLNKKHPLFKELKKILFQEIGIEFELKSLFKNLKGVEKVFVYGSYASGKNRTDSDIDIMIVGSPNKAKIEDKISELEKRYQREINYQILATEVFNKKRKEKNPFIMEILKKNKIILGGDKNEF
jgi:predicted nucleotidyltransferase